MDQSLWKSLTFLSLKSVKSRFSQLAVPPVVLLLYFAKQKEQNLINNFAFFWKKWFCFPRGKVKIGLFKSFEYGCSYGKKSCACCRRSSVIRQYDTRSTPKVKHRKGSNLHHSVVCCLKKLEVSPFGVASSERASSYMNINLKKLHWMGLSSN